MTVLLPWFALVVTILAGWAIIKRLSTSMVLLFAGLAMISFAVICGVHGFLPKGVKPSGFVWFDIFELLRSIATKQTSGIGLLIMVAGGYAAYMDRIGAAHALVRVCVKPLDALSSPYLVGLPHRSGSGHCDPECRRFGYAAVGCSLSDSSRCRMFCCCFCRCYWYICRYDVRAGLRYC